MMADRSNWRVRKYKLGEEPEVDEATIAMTHGQRIELACLLSEQQWGIFAPESVDGGFRRDVARVIRSRR
jgi:hypothetical protein